MVTSLAPPPHPFPARMAPALALSALDSAPPGSVVLDPMCGSGTVLRAASERGHSALGFDLDPLSVLMARVWTTPLATDRLLEAGHRVMSIASRLHGEALQLPWVDNDPETLRFVRFWYGPDQEVALRRLVLAMRTTRGSIGDALRLSLSRIIVTKERGASFARDVSHSRPHRVMDSNDFDVTHAFARSLQRVATQLRDNPPRSGVSVNRGDVRRLTSVPSESVDVVVTSPPYLNAIDYLRGHRLSLVWLGYRLSALRTLRATSIGSERAPDRSHNSELLSVLLSEVGPRRPLSPRVERIFQRYVLDMYAALAEIIRVLRARGQAVLVIGNSRLAGVFVDNANAILACAEFAGLQFVERYERPLPPARRYLPPPASNTEQAIKKRMRSETVLRFFRPPSPAT